MKNLLFIFLILTFFSCSDNAGKISSADSANAIDENNNAMQDTAVSPNPNGYAPPNAKIDTSEYRKDSIRRRNDK